MDRNTWDIVVVGAGPAGSSAAGAAARQGMRVLVLERKERIGFPVRCAEYIPGQLLGLAEVGRDFVVQAVDGMKTYFSGRLINESSFPGCVIDRCRFDVALATKAQEAGAEIRTGVSVTGFRGGALFIRSVSGERRTVDARVIIGADGPHSRIGRQIGLKNTNLIPGIQVRAALTAPLKMTEVHFLDDIHAGYGWVFPRGDHANVGLGMKPRAGGVSLAHALNRFTARLVDRGIITQEFRSRTAGWIPAEPLRRFASDNVYLVGDAAGHTHPITGAGIAQAVLGGRMAGKHAALAVKSGDPASGGEAYQEEWADTFAESHDRAWNRRLLMESRWNELEEVIRSCWVTFREYHADA
jgi:digeranylgeranylglycerophospholipid reductase